VGSDLAPLPPAAFRLALSCPATAPIDVDYTTAAGSATPGSDFVAASGTLVFAAGESEQILNVEVLGDETDEDDESFSLVLSQPTGALLLDPVADAVILDDDGAVTISVADVAVLEGDAGTGDAVFEIRLSAVSGRVVELNYATADATATSGEDYGVRAGTLSFQPGEISHSVSVPVAGDLLGEGDETFLLRLSDPVHATLGHGEATATIRDDDEVAISIDDVIRMEGDEGTTEATFTVRLSLVSAHEITVAYATADVDAVAGEDYGTTQGTLSFPPGATTRTLSVPILGDAVREPHESFLVVLSAPTHAVLADPEGWGTIFDDDGILISIADLTLVEGDDGDSIEAVFVVSLNRPGAEEVSVDFATVAGSAVDPDDYSGASGTLVFAPGTTALEVPVAIVADLIEERSERFAVELANAVGGEILVARGEAAIYDNDGWYLNDRGVEEPQIIDDCIELTSGDYQTDGNAWKKQLLDLSWNFDKTFRIFLGESDAGSDGIVFALQSQGGTAVGYGGGGLGFYSIKPSLGVEVDTKLYYYDRDIDDDHLAVDVNGSPWHKGHAPVYAREPERNIEDGREHRLRVI